MKAVAITIAFIVVAVAAFFVGRRLPATNLQTEIAGLKNLAVSQEKTIAKMDSTIGAYEVAIMGFVKSFDEFKADNLSALKQMERNAQRGREFHGNQIRKLAELEKRRNELIEEAAKFDL